MLGIPMNTAIKEYDSVAWELHLEVEFAKNLCDISKNERSKQQARRIYARSVFSYIEGIVFQLKQLALAQGKKDGVEFSVAERLLIDGEKFSVKNNGEVDSKIETIELLANIRLAEKLFVKGYSSSYKADYSDVGWGKLKTAKRIRNRLTHPKCNNDLNISDEDFGILTDADKWFWNWFPNLLEKCGFHDKSKPNK
jgi:phage anti-repressor protein